MRRYFETATNVVILATCTAVAYVLFYAPPRTAQGEPPAPATLSIVQTGDRLPALIDLPLPGRDKTLLLVLHSSCSFCTASMPFYSRIANGVRSQQTANRVQLVVLSREPLASIERYLGEHKLSVSKVVSMTPPIGAGLRIPGTPTLILLDRDGVVRNVWFGKLSEQGEKEVEAAIADTSS